MEYQNIIGLSRLYDMQSTYNDQTVTAGEIIYRQIFEEGTDSVADNTKGVQSFIATFLYREDALIDAYDAALKTSGQNE